MNRIDREITDPNEILRLLDRCDTVRIGLMNGEYPYVVPMSFGLDAQQNPPVIYLHGAKTGLKVDCIRSNPNVCVEADIFHRIHSTGTGITTLYESVIAFGKAYEVSGDERVRGLKTLLEHYGSGSHPITNCRGFMNTAVFKVVLERMSGKRNLPDEN